MSFIQFFRASLLIVFFLSLGGCSARGFGSLASGACRFVHDPTAKRACADVARTVYVEWTQREKEEQIAARRRVLERPIPRADDTPRPPPGKSQEIVLAPKERPREVWKSPDNPDRGGSEEIEKVVKEHDQECVTTTRRVRDGDREEVKETMMCRRYGDSEFHEVSGHAANDRTEGRTHAG